MALKSSQTPIKDQELNENICELDHSNESNLTDFSAFDYNVNKPYF